MRIIALILLMCSATAAVAASDTNSGEPLFRFHYEAAIGDNPESMYILANMYESGRGVKQDYDEAIKWYSKASKFGNTRAATKVQEVLRKKSLALTQAEELARKKEEQKTLSDDALRQQLDDAHALTQQLDAEKLAAEKAKADAEQAALLLQQKIDLVKSEAEKAQDEAEKIRWQQQQLIREKAKLENLRQSLLAQEKQQQVEADNTVEEATPPPPSPVKEFRADPCDGPSARFMSTCR